VRKRSWVERPAGVVVALALALALAACGGDDTGAGDTSGGEGTILDVAYVTTRQHPYGIAVDAFVANCGVEYVASTPQQLTELQSTSAAAVAQLAPDTREYVKRIEAAKEVLGPPPAPPPLPTTKTGPCPPPPG
jgi:hypothetical protein